MLSPRFLRLLLTFLATLLPARAQLGDKPGEEQRPLVPPEQIPPAPALTAEKALASFALPSGYKLEIAASDPLVQEPVAIAFGADGRLWVVEMRSYMADLEGRGEIEPIGRVVVLSDADGDGRYDRSQTFVDNLVMPRSVAPIADGVLVGAPPELAFWRDTDGDGKADQKTLLATDYGIKVDPARPQLSNPEAAPNSLLWAIDNWIYSAAYSKKFRYVRGSWETRSTPYRGQWGLSQDDAGRMYHNSNSTQLRADFILADYLWRNPHYSNLKGTNVIVGEDNLVWPSRVTPGINRGYQPPMLREGRLKAFTAACAPWVYRGDLLPELYGDVFVAEPAAHFVRRAKLEERDGAVRARNAYDQNEFLTSLDERFRPVNFTTGPDGALYIVDLYRGVLQHRIAITSYLRKQIEARGLEHPQHLGRVYRVVPAGRPTPRATRIAHLSTAEWIEKLSHPNSWWRETAQRVLVERGESPAVPAVRKVALNSPRPQAQIHALAVLEGLAGLDREVLASVLRNAEPMALIAAMRFAEPFLTSKGGDELKTRLLALAQHPHRDVQLQSILSLGEARDSTIDRKMADVVAAHVKQLYVPDAFYSGLKGREFALFEQLWADATWAKAQLPGSTEVLAGLIRGVVMSHEPPAVAGALSVIAELGAAGDRRAALFLENAATAMTASRRIITLPKEPAGWSRLTRTPAYKAQAAKLNEKLAWPGKTGAASTRVTPLTEPERARFESGKAFFTAICAGCHQVDGRGLEGLAPPLLDSEWVTGIPGRFVRIVLHGIQGPITVAGRMYTGEMPGLGASLDDEQIAAITTYLRREWGHSASPVSPAEVRAIRTSTAARSDGWIVRELLGVN